MASDTSPQNQRVQVLEALGAEDRIWLDDQLKEYRELLDFLRDN